MPSAATGAAKILLNQNGVLTEGGLYAFTRTPAVTGVNTTILSSQGGTPVTITGTDLEPTVMASTTVSFGSVPCAIVSQDSNQLVCIAGAGTGTGTGVQKALKVHTQTYGTADVSQEAIFGQDPWVYGISPTSTFSGQEIVSNGTGFSTTMAENTVNIGSSACAITAATASSITCTVGQHNIGTKAVAVKVTGKGNTGGAAEFTWKAALSSVQPATGSINGGTMVTLTGRGFSSLAVVKVRIQGRECIVAGAGSGTAATTIVCQVCRY